MNLKKNLILVGISIISLILALFTVKRPVFFNFGQRNYSYSKPKELTPSLSAPITVVQNQDKPKMIDFPKEGIPVLMYHSISTIPGNSLGVPVKQFIDEMVWLHQQNYHSISMEDLYQALLNKAQVPEKPILLTFDDGYADNYSSAWPILRQNGFRGTFFIITNSVGPGMMNWNQINDLSRQGNSIGSHTVHHPDLSRLSYKKQENELANSKQELENHLGITEMAFCFPSGRYNKITLDLMTKLGYNLGFTTFSGRVHLGDNLLTLKRIRIYGGMPIASFQNLFSN